MILVNIRCKPQNRQSLGDPPCDLWHPAKGGPDPRLGTKVLTQWFPAFFYLDPPTFVSKESWATPQKCLRGAWIWFWKSYKNPEISIFLVDMFKSDFVRTDKAPNGGLERKLVTSVPTKCLWFEVYFISCVTAYFHVSALFYCLLSADRSHVKLLPTKAWTK